MVYKIDNAGVYMDCYLVNIKNNTYYDGMGWLEIDFDYVDVQPPDAKVVKWEINEWVVIEEYPIEPQEPQSPTPEERLSAIEEVMMMLI